jgi:hypothetical protein
MATTGETGQARLRTGRLRGGAREVPVLLAGLLVYFGVRGITHTDPTVALRNALDLVAFERQFDLYVEPGLQRLVSDSPHVLTAMNWVYIWGHWPVIAATLLWLFLRHPDGYRRTRNAMVLSGGIGLVVFVLFPVAPPRLAELGLVDTVTQYSSAYRVLQPPAFVNQYAAMPSLHVGWDLLMGIAVFAYARVRAVRLVGLLLPVLMVAAVVLTANHYVVDAAVGAGLVTVSLLAVRRLESLRRGSPRGPTRVPEPVLGPVPEPAPQPLLDPVPVLRPQPAPRIPGQRAGERWSDRAPRAAEQPVGPRQRDH